MKLCLKSHQRWTACSSESAKLRKFFLLSLSLSFARLFSHSATFRCVSISICIQHGMITFLEVKTFFPSFFVFPCMFCCCCRRRRRAECVSVPRHITNVTKCFNTLGIRTQDNVLILKHPTRMEPVSGSWLRKQRGKKPGTKMSRKVKLAFREHDTQKKKTTSSV